MSPKPEFHQPTPEQFKDLTTLPAGLDYSVAQKAFLLLLAAEAFSRDVQPWKLNALRTVLTTQQAVTDFQEYLKTLAEEQNLTTLGDTELKTLMDAHYINVPNAKDWVLAQQQAMPIKFIARTLLIARNYIQQAELLSKGGILEQEDHQNSQLFIFPAEWEEKHGSGKLALPSFGVLNIPKDPDVYDGYTKVGWLLANPNRTSSWLGPETKVIATIDLGAENNPPVASLLPPPPAPVINPQTTEVLKQAILQMIKVEVNSLLSIEVIAGLVAKQVAQNPTAIQQGLQKVFSIGSNTSAAASFDQAAKKAVSDFMSSGGKDFVAVQVGNYLKQNINATKIEQEAIKAMTNNIDQYFAHVFSRIVVCNDDGEPIGRLGFKDGTTTMKAPMPNNPLTVANKLAKVDAAATAAKKGDDSPF